MCKANGTKEAYATKTNEGATVARKKLLFIVGSLRAGSFNRALADYAAHVVGDRAQVDYLDYSDVPFMDEDIEFPAPASVERVRRQVDEADGVLDLHSRVQFQLSRRAEERARLAEPAPGCWRP